MIVENLIVGNISDHFAGGVAIGGAGELRNNTIVANLVGDFDGVAGIVVLGSATVSHNIIVGNHPRTPGGAASAIRCINAFGASVWCNDVWGNDSDVIDCATGTVDSNFAADPLFCGQTDFGISTNSPCASGPCGLVGAEPPSCTTTTVRSVSWGEIKQLYREVSK